MSNTTKPEARRVMLEVWSTEDKQPETRRISDDIRASTNVIVWRNWNETYSNLHGCRMVRGMWRANVHLPR
jgi:hypothetical protein